MLLALAPVALAQSVRWDAQTDLPITLAAGGTWALLYAQVEPGLQPGESAGTPTGIDALVPSTGSKAADTVSDVLAYGGVALGLGATLADGAIQRDAPAARAGVWLEAVALDALATETLKLAVRRPRPYTATFSTGDLDDDLSFPSGHTSFTAASLVSAARLYDLSPGATPAGRVVAYGSAGALTVAVGTLRVASREHFPSDVVAGALLGGAFGYVVPGLHRLPVDVAVTPTGVSVSGRL